MSVCCGRRYQWKSELLSSKDVPSSLQNCMVGHVRVFAKPCELKELNFLQALLCSDSGLCMAEVNLQNLLGRYSHVSSSISSVFTFSCDFRKCGLRGTACCKWISMALRCGIPIVSSQLLIEIGKIPSVGVDWVKGKAPSAHTMISVSKREV